jgi:hypothetical protein
MPPACRFEPNSCKGIGDGQLWFKVGADDEEEEKYEAG